MKGRDNPAKHEDICRKISEGKKGKKVKHTRPLSDKQLKHLGQLAKERKGKHHSANTRLKISTSRRGKCIGKNNPMFGKQHTKATKGKMKKAQRARHDEYQRYISRKAEAFRIDIQTDSVLIQRREGFQKGGKLDSHGYIIGTIPTDAYLGIPPSAGVYVYHIAAKDRDFVNTVAKCLEQIGIEVNINRRKKGNLWYVRTSKKDIEQFLSFLRIEKDTQWVFDQKIFALSSNFRRSALVAVCDAEGCITNARSGESPVSRRITITNSSALLLDQIKSLLESFGVKSYIYLHRGPRKAVIKGEVFQFKKQVFTLIITGYENLHNFRNAIGFSITRKQDKLNKAVESYRKIERQYAAKDYDLVLQLSKHFPSYTDISKITHIPVTTIRNWVLHGTKPRSMKNGALL